jgi:hypothetical protein
MPVRFQRHRTKRWKKPPNGRCVNRPSQYGNPFELRPEAIGDPAAHARAAALYHSWITAPEQAALLAHARRDLRGLDLGCTCAPGLPCHADVLLDLVNGD